MTQELGLEAYDPYFRGQCLTTRYFDTQMLALRKARVKGDHYLTLRLRCYEPEGGEGGEVYALSAKTEAEKWRQEISALEAQMVHDMPGRISSYLPGDLQARLLELAGEEPLVVAAKITCKRFAVENPRDRLTLDLGVQTDTGKDLPFGVLELKSTDPGIPPPARFGAIDLRPLKISKFLWATGY
jgi:hypothetical protein